MLHAKALSDPQVVEQGTLLNLKQPSVQFKVRQVRWSHLHAEIYNGNICVVEFVQLVSFSKIKLFKP